MERAPEIFKVSLRETEVGIITPAPNNLYNICGPHIEEGMLLLDKESYEYHTLTTQCLYLSKRGGSDLHTLIASHYTRIQKADSDDQKKLSRTI